MKYCNIHKLEYEDHVPYCPFCIGEKMIDFTHGDKAHEVFERAKLELDNEGLDEGDLIGIEFED